MAILQSHFHLKRLPIFRLMLRVHEAPACPFKYCHTTVSLLGSPSAISLWNFKMLWCIPLPFSLRNHSGKNNSTSSSARVGPISAPVNLDDQVRRFQRRHPDSATNGEFFKYRRDIDIAKYICGQTPVLSILSPIKMVFRKQLSVECLFCLQSYHRLNTTMRM